MSTCMLIVQREFIGWRELMIKLFVVIIAVALYIMCWLVTVPLVPALIIKGKISDIWLKLDIFWPILWLYLIIKYGVEGINYLVLAFTDIYEVYK